MYIYIYILQKNPSFLDVGAAREELAKLKMDARGPLLVLVFSPTWSKLG